MFVFIFFILSPWKSFLRSKYFLCLIYVTFNQASSSQSKAKIFPKECFTTRTYPFRDHFRAHDKHRGDYTKSRFVVAAFDNSRGLIYIFCMPTSIFLSI